MKQLLILSGKGGTGKTIVASAFIKLSQARAYADCDIDAPNLHLIMQHKEPGDSTDFYGMGKAAINTDTCLNCGLCFQTCCFGAIAMSNNCYWVDQCLCEGCGVCESICPVQAVNIVPNIAGGLLLYQGDTVFSTGQLKMGSGTSGKLVTEVKKRLQQQAADVDLAVIDGSPGIGCPVIASLSGVDMVLIVTEPSLSGLKDMERLVHLAGQMQVQPGICINKYDINSELAELIEIRCSENGLSFMGKIPFDDRVVEAVNQGLSIVDIDCASGRAVREVFAATVKMLEK